MGDRQQHHIAGARKRIGRGDEAGRPVFAPILAGGGFTRPEVCWLIQSIVVRFGPTIGAVSATGFPDFELSLMPCGQLR